MDRWPAHLTCAVVDVGAGGVRLAVRGEVDLASAPAMRRFAEAQLDAVPAGGALVIDLSEVGFLSAAGLRELVGIAAAGRLRGVPVRLGPASELVERVLEAGRGRRDVAAAALPTTEGAGHGSG